jgi:hypothetical protein
MSSGVRYGGQRQSSQTADVEMESGPPQRRHVMATRADGAGALTTVAAIVAACAPCDPRASRSLAAQQLLCRLRPFRSSPTRIVIPQARHGMPACLSVALAILVSRFAGALAPLRMV